jgi:hypothetical protein
VSAFRLPLLLAAAGASLVGQTPPFTVDRSLIDFGSQPVGNPTLPQGIMVSYPLTSSTFVPPPITFSVASSSPAVFTPDTAGFTLSAGQNRVVNVRFTPNTLGEIFGALTVTGFSNNQNIGSRSVELVGFGTPGFAVTPVPIHLGNVLLGCRNTRSLFISTSVLLNFSIESSNPPFTASPTSFRTQGNQTVAVTFTPTAPGPTSSVLTITGSTGETGQTHRVMAEGTGVDIVANPAILDFGAVPLGVTAGAQTITFATNPAAPIPISPTVASSAAYRVTVNGNLATVTFTPPSEGTFNENLVFTFVRQEEGFLPCTTTRTVAVRGSGIRLNLTADPRSIDFGRVLRGETSSPRTTNVANSTSFTFSGAATVDNEAFSVTPANFTLPAGRSQSFSLTFRPTAEGPVSGVLTLNLTGTGVGTTFQTRVVVGLTGEGLGPAVLAVAPATLDFGDVSVGSSALRTVTVSNSGGTAAAVTATASNAAFSAAPGSFNLAPGGSQVVNISFSPPAAGAVQAAVTFATAGSSRDLAVTGRGVAPSLVYQFTSGQAPSSSINPGGSISFPATNVGASSDFVQFEIRNTGSGPATINSITSASGVFVLDGLPALPAVVAAGGSVSFRIAFRPSSPGRNTGSLSIAGTQFNLSGNGLISAVNFTGSGTSLTPATQPQVGLSVPVSFSTPVSGQLILSFSPNAAGAPDDPAIQFASGGRTANFTIPAGSTTAQFGNASQIAFQSGTVAGTITARVVLQAGGEDVTPSPAPSRAYTIARGAPVIRSLAIANRTAASFQAVIVAFAVTREVNTLNFTFTASGTGSLQTTSLPVEVGTLFGNWYRSADAAPHGGAFTITVPFNVTGDLAAVRSLSVTLNNGDGASQAMSANF